MKMSDVFKGLASSKYLDEEALSELANGEDSGNNFSLRDDRYWLATTKKHMDYAAHAINHHDELVEALELLIGSQKEAHIGGIRLDVHPADMENAIAILNKAKGLDK